MAMGPEEAPVIIHEYADFHCPFCRRGAHTMRQVMEAYDGKVRWVFHHFPLSSTPGEGSFLTHEASACAAEQGKFWEFHDKFFSSPPVTDWSQSAQELKLDEVKFQTCLSEGRSRNMILEDRKEGQKKGVSGTPAFFINQYRMEGAYPFEFFSQVIDSLLETGKAPLPLGAADGPIEINDLAGRPSQGVEDAEIVLVEFGDYHCPFCSRFQPTLKMLMEKYEGNIRHVFRHFPLGMHPDAARAHAASECAHQQGQFWGYHEVLFENLAQSRTVKGLTQLAAQTGLDLKVFEACLSSEETANRIQADLDAAAQYGVQATPTIFINGEKVQGAQTLDVFSSMIDEQLNTKVS